MTTPTPNDMPGANPQLQEPVSTAPPQDDKPPEPVQQQQPAPEAGKPPETGGPDTIEYWQRRAREWEDKGKVKQELVDKARKWDEAEAKNRTQAENDRIAIQQANERAERAEALAARERVARETGVLPEFLTGGSEEEMRATAAKLMEWRGSQQNSEPPQKPPTAAVPASTVTSADKLGHAPNQIQQLTKEQFVALPPAERMAAVRAGQCVNLGIGKPHEQRRMGNEVEIGAHAGAKR